MTDSYKIAKEAWVSNLTGSTMTEICYVMLSGPLTILLHRSLTYALDIAKIPNSASDIAKKSIPPTSDITKIGEKPISSSLDIAKISTFLFFVLPTIISFTDFDYTSLLYMTMMTMALMSTGYLYLKRKLWGQNFSAEPFHELRKPFLTIFRSMMMLSTCIAILAVDFPIFPRRFAKTENFGISLMDIGVGGFTVSLGLVSWKTRDTPQNSPSSSTSLPTRIFFSLKKIFPVLILAFLRFFVLQISNYPQHVSEYGVHWNFFTTLAWVTFFGTLFNVDANWGCLVGGGVAILHQGVLSGLKMGDYVSSGVPRETLVSANREGIFSLPGYIALYFISTWLGHHIQKKRSTLWEWLVLFFELSFFSATCWILGYLSETTLGLPCSRKTANLVYILYVLSVSTQPLALFLLVDILIKPQIPPLLDIISGQRNAQLIFFLVANVLTGLVNLLMETIYTPPLVSFGVIVGYMMVTYWIASWVIWFMNEWSRKKG